MFVGAFLCIDVWTFAVTASFLVEPGASVQESCTGC